MDPRHLAIDERLKTDTCVYCHRKANTRDHVPSRVLLDEPYPPQLPTVDACEKCNTGFSSDEEYLSCFIECVLCGATEPGSLRRPKVKRILHEKPKLREQIHESMTRDGDALLWKLETERVKKVIVKLATGHAAYELVTQDEPPGHIEFRPLIVAAIDADVLPVETQATRRIPNRRACATPQVMPLSLNEPVG